MAFDMAPQAKNSFSVFKWLGQNEFLEEYLITRENYTKFKFQAVKEGFIGVQLSRYRF